MSGKSPLNVVKITLKSGKVVLLREPKIQDIETATQIAGKEAGDNQALLSITLQKEMLRKLLVAVDGKELSKSDKLQLDKLFKVPEYLRLTNIVQKLMDDGQGNEEMALGFQEYESASATTGEQ